ncbi:hypothetical protein M569_17638 [Genlisea aurea]|uniref:Uncharacterized protein n=1 Tax=Genlisea aurea TaxID=192259 RepID=S8D3B2_9LAMI|nr:hypothetical protein M569_17638 [Genlisea aurea]
MRCKKHLGDLSSALGVCASCLRESLFAVMSAQAEIHRDCRNKEEALPPTHPSPANHRFFSTKQGGGRISSLILAIFRFKSDKVDADSTDPMNLSAKSWFQAAKSIKAPTPRNLDNRGRGLSPTRNSSGYSSESSPYQRQNPAATRRRGKVPAHIAGMAFCLSPLVRASPSRQWKSTEIYTGWNLRATARPHLSSAAFFLKNRSRKLTDLGRNYDHPSGI